ncbi:MAG: endolytic transglycosylase MltG [Oscillospiraceae bacterium]|nr:endolytic transglycosylase MltG [Oscillospiraceae bacterium]
MRKKRFRIGILIVLLLCLAACGPIAENPPAGTSGDITAGEATTFGIDFPDIPVVAPPATSTAGPKPTEPPVAVPTGTETVAVVIPEGFTFDQVARRLEANGVCSAADFTNTAQTYQIQSFPASIHPQCCYRMEGMLYPDTYEFYLGENPESVLRRFLNNYAEKSGLPDFQTLILASVIERETRSDEHMAMVSSVFHNRLAQGMRLQADATRAYVRDHIEKDPLVPDPGQYAERYDTYQCAALPAGPICSPGRRAIEAAKHPSQSGYLYYFFGKDETNHYTTSYEDHLAAIKIYGLG